MGMKSLKWEGIGTKNLFPHTSSPDFRTKFQKEVPFLEITELLFNTV